MININKNIIAYIYFFFIFFPYLKFFTSGIDTAPYALVFSTIIFLLIKKKSLPTELWTLFILFLLSIMSLSLNFNYLAFLLLAGYFSVFIIAGSTYFILRLNDKVNLKLINFFFYIWFTIGLVQTFVNKDFMTSILTRHSTSYDRGVTGLAAEPSFYAFIMLFFLIINYIYNFKPLITFTLTLFSVIFFAKSATGTFILCIFIIFFFLLFRIRVKTFLFISLLIAILIFLIFTKDILINTRLFYLMSDFLSDPVIIFINDESANARMLSIVTGFVASKNYYFLINPFNDFREQTSIIYDEYLYYIHPFNFGLIADRAMSGTGGAFFNIGIFSILYYFIIYRLSFKCFKSRKKAFYLSFCLFILMTTAIPYSFPMFGFIFGLLAFKARTESSKKLK
jgi:hypothetical protein